MIGRLNGHLLEKTAPWVVIDCAGVGYEVQVPMSTFFHLPECGQPCMLHTHQVIREDAHLLYGFSTGQERSVFRSLIKVNGVGPKIALAVLSTLSPNEFLLAIQSQETVRLVQVPGIGKKVAERLLVELKGQFSGLGNAAGLANTQPHVLNPSDEISQALVALGYSEKETQAACKNLPQGSTVTDGLKLALKNLAKS